MKLSFQLLAKLAISCCLLPLALINWYIQHQQASYVSNYDGGYHQWNYRFLGASRRPTINHPTTRSGDWSLLSNTPALPVNASRQQRLSPKSDLHSSKLSTTKGRSKNHDPSMRACILVRNDNKLLAEWIAYHYTVLPLRHLIIGSDENATEDPMDVLELWNDTDLHYQVWNVTTYMGHNAVKYKFHNPQFRYLQRQNRFLTKCMNYFQETKNLGWVALVDTDEYIKLNPLDNERSRYYFSSTKPHALHRWTPKQLNLTRPFMSLNETMADRVKERERLRQLLVWNEQAPPLPPQQQRNVPTILQVLEEYSLKHGTLPCHAMSRLRYSAVKDDHANYTSLVQSLCHPQLDPMIVSNIDTSKLSTIRYLYHVPFEDSKRNCRAKVLVDLRRIAAPLSRSSSSTGNYNNNNNNDTTNNKKNNINHVNIIRNPHKPLDACPGSYIPDIASFIHVNHYLQDFQVYAGRQGDVRHQSNSRGMAEWIKSGAHAKDGIRCDHIHGWLNEFVEHFGMDQAKKLLRQT